MKHIFVIFFCLACRLSVTAQGGQWTWLQGDSTGDNSDFYQQINVPDPRNTPGSLNPVNTWTDNKGNFWMFGGRTLVKRFDGQMIPVSSNQLWKYNPFLNAWTLVMGMNGLSPDDDDAEGSYGPKGVFSPSSIPPKLRSSAAIWTDTSGKFWLFGGKIGYRDFGSKNDLWKFDPVNSQWMWVSGNGPASAFAGDPVYGRKGVPDSLNHPGARSDMIYWQDKNGNFYLYGGVRDITHAVYSDIWKYQPSTNRWTWIGGNQWLPGTYPPPVYGTKGTPADGNSPGVLPSRNDLFGWTDPQGKVWIYCNTELWYYKPETNQWAWVNGNRNSLPKLRPGIKGVSAPDNNPGFRYEYAKCADTSGNLWIYGGYLLDGLPGYNYFNDLWKYTLLTGQWTWMGGDSSFNRNADFGVKGKASISNQPGSRSTSRTWTDSDGNLWLYGGMRRNVQPGPLAPSVLHLNDLWKLAKPDLIGSAIKLQEFSASLLEAHVVLEWITSYEQNSKEFVVQHSTDSIQFTNLATVPASNSASGLHYQFIHLMPSNGNNYYRLKLVKTDGSFEFSDTLDVYFTKDSFSYTIVQNPTRNQLLVETKTNHASMLEIIIRNSLGHLLSRNYKTIAEGRSVQHIPVSQLSPGIYFISITKDNKVITKSFLKL